MRIRARSTRAGRSRECCPTRSSERLAQTLSLPESLYVRIH
jgi:hypothetical protein